MKYTKGPWEIIKQERDVFGEMPILIAGQRPGANENFGDVIAELSETGRQEDDARLIAVAPDLLELLIGLHKETGYQHTEDFLQSLLGKNPDSKSGEWT